MKYNVGSNIVMKVNYPRELNGSMIPQISFAVKIVMDKESLQITYNPENKLRATETLN